MKGFDTSLAVHVDAAYLSEVKYKELEGGTYILKIGMDVSIFFPSRSSMKEALSNVLEQMAAYE